MSILIKGMDMPTNCGDCKAFVCYRQWAGDVGDCFCGITKNDAKAKEKNADCPLTPVPPHGRLIDADALIDAIIAKYIRHERNRELVFAVAEIKQDLADIINELPTILEAEEGE